MPKAKNPFILLVISGDLERLHMALTTATAAAAVGHRVFFFLSHSALKAFKNDAFEKLDTALYSRIENADTVQDFSLLLDAAAALDIHFRLCEASLAHYNLDISDFSPRLKAKSAGLATIFEKAETATWLTF